MLPLMVSKAQKNILRDHTNFCHPQIIFAVMVFEVQLKNALRDYQNFCHPQVIFCCNGIWRTKKYWEITRISVTHNLYVGVMVFEGQKTLLTEHHIMCVAHKLYFVVIVFEGQTNLRIYQQYVCSLQVYVWQKKLTISKFILCWTCNGRHW